MQGLGFTDEIPEATAATITGEARALLAGHEPFDIEVGEVVVSDEAIALPAKPAAPVRGLRDSVRRAIGSVLGEDQVPENAERYRPHVSLAYIAADGPALPYVEAVKAVEDAPAHVRVARVDLIEMHRDRRMYEWEVIASLPLGRK